MPLFALLPFELRMDCEIHGVYPSKVLRSSGVDVKTKNITIIILCVFFLLIFSETIDAQDHIDPLKPNRSLTELARPKNWVAQGGCWTFTDSGIIAQAGVMGRHLFYYNEKRFTDFELQARVEKLAQDGPFGLVVRYDERKKEGYIFLLFPHGDFKFTTIEQEPEHTLFQEPAENMNRDINVWNTIKIICHGSTFEFHINDRLLTVVTDKSYGSGRIGFFLGGDPRQKAVFQIISFKEF